MDPGSDAVVKLLTSTSPKKTIWKLYIRANEQKSVSGIAPGSYTVRFALGLDWDITRKMFLRDSAFYQSGKELDFAEIKSMGDEPDQYDVVEITLNTVFNGNLRREPIDERTFNEGDPEN
jgi:hypothetical protein